METVKGSPRAWGLGAAGGAFAAVKGLRKVLGGRGAPSWYITQTHRTHNAGSEPGGQVRFRGVTTSHAFRSWAECALGCEMRVGCQRVCGQGRGRGAPALPPHSAARPSALRSPVG